MTAEAAERWGDAAWDARPSPFRLCRWGLVDAYRLHHPETGRYTWWDYRAGSFHKNFGMRIDHLLVTHSVAGRPYGRRSIARLEKASRSLRTMRRWWSTSTRPVTPSTRDGRRPRRASPRACGSKA